MVETILREGGPKSVKMCSQKRKCECPGMHFGGTWGSAEPAGEALNRCGSGLDVNLRSPGCVFS